jgi:hypothetical protein
MGQTLGGNRAMNRQITQSTFKQFEQDAPLHSTYISDDKGGWASLPDVFKDAPELKFYRVRNAILETYSDVRVWIAPEKAGPLTFNEFVTEQGITWDREQFHAWIQRQDAQLDSIDWFTLWQAFISQQDYADERDTQQDALR